MSGPTGSSPSDGSQRPPDCVPPEVPAAGSRAARDPRKHLRLVVAAEWGAALALTAFIVVLHIRVLAHAGPMWRDEANTVAVATQPTLGHVVGALEYESFPVLPFALVRAWVGLGLESDQALRTLGFVVGLLLLGAVWAYGWFFRIGPPLLALLLVGLNPVVIRWGDSLRAYGLAATAIALAFGLLWHVTRVPSRKVVGLAALAAIVSVQCSYQNAVLLLATCVVTAALSLGNGNRKAAGACLGIGTLASASLLPYLGIVRRAGDHFAISMLPKEHLNLIGVFAEALGSHQMVGHGGTAVRWLWPLVALTGTAAAVQAIRRAGSTQAARRTRDMAIYGTACLWSTLASFFVLLVRVRFPTQPWYYIPLLVMLAGALEAANAAWLSRLSWRIGRVVASVLLAAVFAIPGYRLTGLRQTNVDLVARAVEASAGPRDLIVIDPWFCSISFLRYYHGRVRSETVPPLADNVIHRFDLLKEKVATREPLRPLLSAVASTLSAGGTVWIVGQLTIPPPGTPIEELPPAPNGPMGWWSSVYVNTWSLQLGRFLWSHGTRGTIPSYPRVATIGSYESLNVWGVAGWRESP